MPATNFGVAQITPDAGGRAMFERFELSTCLRERNSVGKIFRVTQALFRGFGAKNDAANFGLIMNL